MYKYHIYTCTVRYQSYGPVPNFGQGPKKALLSLFGRGSKKRPNKGLRTKLWSVVMVKRDRKTKTKRSRLVKLLLSSSLNPSMQTRIEVEHEAEGEKGSEHGEEELE